MPTFDIVSEIDMHEVRNSVDQASREIVNRYDFKNTESSLVFNEDSIAMASSTERRLEALRQVLEEKFVKRNVSLKSFEYGPIQSVAGSRVRQTITLQSGISSDKARKLNKFIKDLRIKGIQSSTQGEHIRVQSKKRDDLQSVITSLKETDFGIPLQYINFRS